MAVINDTVGALLAGAHTDQDCQIGLILGENFIIILIHIKAEGCPH